MMTCGSRPFAGLSGKRVMRTTLRSGHAQSFRQLRPPTASEARPNSHDGSATFDLRDEFVAITPAPDPPGRRRREMGYAHDGGRIAEAVEDLTPGFPGLPRVVVGPHAELRVFSLDRRVDHVARDQGVPARVANKY